MTIPCSNPAVEILSQGDEVVSGQVTDTNAAWLAQALTPSGFRVRRHTVVGDCLDDIVAVLKEVAVRADIVLCSGGLGPTSDDLTTAAVSQAFGLPLQLDPVALAMIEQQMSQRGRRMAACNEKQAWLPSGAVRLDNLWGTAPGFSVWQGACWLVFMPGVPREMQAMFRHRVEPQLRANYPLTPPHRTVFHTRGEGESSLQERIDNLNLPASIRLGFLATDHGVQVKLLFAAEVDDRSRQQWIKRVHQALAPAVNRIDSDT